MEPINLIKEVKITESKSKHYMRVSFKAFVRIREEINLESFPNINLLLYDSDGEDFIIPSKIKNIIPLRFRDLQFKERISMS